MNSDQLLCLQKKATIFKGWVGGLFWVWCRRGRTSVAEWKRSQVHLINIIVEWLSPKIVVRKAVEKHVNIM